MAKCNALSGSAVKALSSNCDNLLITNVLIYELGLDILNMYVHSKMNFLGQVFQKLKHEQDTLNIQTDRRDRTHYQPHSRTFQVPVVKAFFKLSSRSYRNINDQLRQSVYI